MTLAARWGLSMVRQAPIVIVVAYGAPALLGEALGALGDTLQVLVVDNSRSELIRAVTDRHGATYVRPERNLGFASGVNLGLRQCPTGRDVLLLNPDARLDETALGGLQERLGDQIAAVAPRLRRPSGEIERTSWPLPTPWSPWWGAVGLSDRMPGRRVFLSGAVLLLNGGALTDVGGFDERYFLYAEETDWQCRALALGWRVVEVASIEAVHVGAATSNDPRLRERFFHGSAELYVRKWFGAKGWWVFRLGSMVAAARRWVTARDPAIRRQAGRTLRLYLAGPARSLPPVEAR